MKHLPFALAIAAIIVIAGMLAVSAADAPRSVVDVKNFACLAEYQSICAGVPLVEAEIRACIKDHKSSFTPHCLALAKEIK